MPRTKLDQELNDLYNQKLLKDKIETHIKGVQKRLKARYVELKKLGVILDKEERDVIALEKLSMRGLFTSLLGNKKEQLERERQEYLLAFMKYHDCQKIIDAKKYEIEILQEKLKSYWKVEPKLKRLIHTKRSQLKFRNRKAAKRIMKLEENIRVQKRKKKEIKEAIDYGKTVIPKLNAVYDDLLIIKSWQFGGTDHPNAKVIAFYNQRNFVKRKLSDVNKVHTSLNRFMSELDDIGNQYQLDYSGFIDQLSNFLGRLYDGLISDWIFHKKIKVSINITIEAIDKIKRLIEMLRNDLEIAELAIKKENELLRDLVMVLDIKEEE